jgi:hypothetical protein
LREQHKTMTFIGLSSATVCMILDHALTAGPVGNAEMLSTEMIPGLRGEPWTRVRYTPTIWVRIPCVRTGIRSRVPLTQRSRLIPQPAERSRRKDAVPAISGPGKPSLRPTP